MTHNKNALIIKIILKTLLVDLSSNVILFLVRSIAILDMKKNFYRQEEKVNSHKTLQDGRVYSPFRKVWTLLCTSRI